MKLPRTRAALIISAAGIAAAVLAYETTRGHSHVYNLAIYSAGIAYYNQWPAIPAPSGWCVQQYVEVGWIPDANPHPHAFTEVRVGSHKVRMRTPFSLIGTPGLIAVIAAGGVALLSLAGLVSLLYSKLQGDAH